MFVYIALAVSFVVSSIAIVLAIRAQMEAAMLRTTLELFGRVLRRVPGVQEIVDDELKKSEIILEHIKAVTKRGDQTFRERFPF